MPDQPAAPVYRSWISSNNLGDQLPRYVRVNTLKIGVEEALKHLESDGYALERLEKEASRKHYKQLVEKLEHPMVYIDPHVDNLLIFSKNADLHDHVLVKQGALILQDKVSTG